MVQTSFFSRPRSTWAEVASGGLREWRHPREIVVPRYACVSEDFSRESRQGSHMQARFYLPMYGRFASPDPARDQHFEDTQSWNIYSYCRNNPVTNLDPDGMDVKYYFYNSTQSHSGSGHVAVAIGSGNNWTFHEASPNPSGNNQPMDSRGIGTQGSNPDVLASQGINGSEFGSATAVLTLVTTPEQDAGAEAAAEKFFAGNPTWVLDKSNCADLGYAVAEGAGTKMDKPKTYSTPPELKESLEKVGAKQPGKVRTDKPGKLDNSTAGVAKKQTKEAASKVVEKAKSLLPKKKEESK